MMIPIPSDVLAGDVLAGAGDSGGSTSELYDRYVRRVPLADGLSPRRCPTLTDLIAHARTHTEPVPPALLAELSELHDRLDAPSRSLDTLARLGRGETVLVFAGQQPALLGGPLYTLHKAATAVAVAARMTAAGVSARAAFWVASDDADLAEAATAYAPGPDRGLRKASIARGRPEGTLVGSLPVTECERAWTTLFGDAVPYPGAPAGARDFGDYLAAHLLALFGPHGLVVVDSRLPALRRAAEPLVARYLGAHEQIARVVDAAGGRYEAVGWDRALHPASTGSALFEIDERGLRRKLEPGEAPGSAESTSLGVLLRPYLQEAVFPSAGFVCGPGELAYLVQSEAAAPLLGVERSPYIPRLSATWIDRTLADLVRSQDPGGPRDLASVSPDAWRALFADPTAVVAGRLERDVPRDVDARLARLTSTLNDELQALEADARGGDGGDAGLADVAASVRKKIDYQIGRIRGHVLERLRREAKAEGRVYTNVGDYLSPRRALQERAFSMLWPLTLASGAAITDALCDAAGRHWDAVQRAESVHLIGDLDALEGPMTTEEPVWRENYESV